jgi:transposase-like protein
MDSKAGGRRQSPALIPQVNESELVERLPARAVAKILGVKVGTLAKWRFLGKGPGGWARVSATLVTYSASEVRRFLAERAGTERR